MFGYGNYQNAYIKTTLLIYLKLPLNHVKYIKIEKIQKIINIIHNPIFSFYLNKYVVSFIPYFNLILLALGKTLNLFAFIILSLLKYGNSF